MTLSACSLSGWQQEEKVNNQATTVSTAQTFYTGWTNSSSGNTIQSLLEKQWVKLEKRINGIYGESYFPIEMKDSSGYTGWFLTFSGEDNRFYKNGYVFFLSKEWNVAGIQYDIPYIQQKLATQKIVSDDMKLMLEKIQKENPYLQSKDDIYRKFIGAPVLILTQSNF